MNLISEEILLDIFGVFEPGVGTITVEKSRQNRADDIALARYFRKKYGGDYIVLSDITSQGIKTPDLLLSGKAIFENKNVSSSSSLDSQTRKALFQLDRNNLAKLHPEISSKKMHHVLVINVNNKMDRIEIKNVLEHRMNRYARENVPCIDYVMIRKRGRLLYLWKVTRSPMNGNVGAKQRGLVSLL